MDSTKLNAYLTRELLDGIRKRFKLERWSLELTVEDEPTSGDTKVQVKHALDLNARVIYLTMYANNIEDERTAYTWLVYIGFYTITAPYGVYHETALKLMPEANRDAADALFDTMDENVVRDLCNVYFDLMHSLTA